MSQAGEVDIIGSHPEIPIEFITNSGSAAPIANQLEILGATALAGTSPVHTTGSGNTVTIVNQISQATGASDATKIGLCAFDSGSFSVDANGLVTLAGGGEAIDSIHPDSGTDPVVPTGAGLVNIVGSGSTTTVGSLNTLTLQLTGLTNHAILVGAGTTTITKLSLGTSGQVLQSGGAAADPVFSTATFPSTATSAGTFLRSDGTNWVASTNTVPDTSAQGDILYASAANTFISLAKNTTATRYLANTGTSNNPNWDQVTLSNGVTGLLPLANGGTNANLTASNGGIFYSTTTAGAILSGTATAGQHLQSGASAAPSWTTATFPATATGTGTLLRADGTNWVATTSTYPNTNAVSTLLYASSANVMAALATANSSMLVTDSSGVPSIASSLIGDFTFTSSTAGATRTLTVSNTNNSNTASIALVQTTTGGASAGDPVHTFTITGATSFSLGLDNSASDAFVMAASTALGTTNVMSVATTGEINFPLQSAALANLGSDQTNITGNSANYTLGTAALTKIFDQNTDLNTNGTFTAPVTGRYHIGSQAFWTNQVVASFWVCTLTTSNRNYVFQNGFAATAQNFSSQGSVLADMDAADTFTVVYQGGGEATNRWTLKGSNANTNMWAYLEC